MNKQPEPVAWMDEFGNVFPFGAQRGPKHLNEPMKPLYTTPPQRTTEQPRQYPQSERAAWVGLTDKEIVQCQQGDIYHFYRRIEAELKEKNT